MFTYPLIFNTEEEHVKHVRDNDIFYRGALKESVTIKEEKKITEPIDNSNIIEKMKKMNEQIIIFQQEKLEREAELIKTKELLQDAKNLEELLEKKNGISVVHKGICDEKYVEIVLKEVAGDKYIVDNGDATKMMDVRLIRKDGSFTIGIECKDKDKVNKADIDKFRRDKVKNRFKRSIFISTKPIKNILEENNQILLQEDELFIVTNDHVFLGAVMKLYLTSLEITEKDDCFDTKTIFDNIIDTYNTWQSTKKQHLNLDQSFLRMLNLTPEFASKVKGHIYLGVTSKFKSGKAPY